VRVPRRSLLVGATAATVAALGWIALPSLLSEGAVNVAGFPPLRYPGFQTWPTLRDFDGPGTVFEIRDGAFEVIGKVSDPPTFAGDEFLGELHASGSWKAGVLEQFLGKLLEINANSNTLIDVGFEPVGVQRWRIDPASASSKIRELLRSQHGTSPLLISESISVREVTCIIKREILVDGRSRIEKDKTGFLELTDADNSRGELKLIRKFEVPYYLFYRPTKINVLPGLSETQILYTSLSTDLHWNRERRKQ
jgi:hypothetical protein